jgi:hypothetical protein
VPFFVKFIRTANILNFSLNKHERLSLIPDGSQKIKIKTKKRRNLTHVNLTNWGLFKAKNAEKNVSSKLV